jgi:hypothetical protein
LTKSKEHTIYADIILASKNAYPNTLTLQQLIQLIKQFRQTRGEKSIGTDRSISNTIKDVVDTKSILRVADGLYKYNIDLEPAKIIPAKPSLSSDLLKKIDTGSSILSGKILSIMELGEELNIHALKIEKFNSISPEEYKNLKWQESGNKKILHCPFFNGHVTVCASPNGTVEGYFKGSERNGKYTTINSYKDYQAFYDLIKMAFFSAFIDHKRDPFSNGNWTHIGFGEDVSIDNNITPFMLKINLLNDFLLEFYSHKQSADETLIRVAIEKKISVVKPETAEEWKNIWSDVAIDLKKYRTNETIDDFKKEIQVDRQTMKEDYVKVIKKTDDLTNTTIKIVDNQNQANSKISTSLDDIKNEVKTSNMKQSDEIQQTKSALYSNIIKIKDDFADYKKNMRAQLANSEKRIQTNVNTLFSDNNTQLVSMQLNLTDIKDAINDNSATLEANQTQITQHEEIITKVIKLLDEGQVQQEEYRAKFNQKQDQQDQIQQENHKETLDLYVKQNMELTDLAKNINVVAKNIDSVSKNVDNVSKNVGELVKDRTSDKKTIEILSQIVQNQEKYIQGQKEKDAAKWHWAKLFNRKK